MYSLPARAVIRLPFSVKLSASFLLVAFMLTCAQAQGNGTAATGTGGKHMIQGKIFFPSGRRADGTIQVKLTSLNSAEITALADSSGAFTFSELAPGNYTIVVNAGDQYEIARESVTIDSDLNLSRMGIQLNTGARRYTVMVTLQPKPDKNNVRTGVINASLAEVPEEARSLYQKALDLIKAGDPQKAVENLQTAVSLYPKFPLALNELGVQYLRLGAAAKAIEPLKSAVQLSPEAFTPRLNLGIALLESNNFLEAEAQLRDALKVTSSPTAHMYLGLALARLKQNNEAEKELKQAIELGGAQLGIAHYYLGGLYWQTGSYKQAADELETYLRLTPNAADAQRIRGTIRDLRAKSTPATDFPDLLSRSFY